MVNEDMDPSVESQIERMLRLLGSDSGAGMSSMVYLSTGGGVPIRQTQLAPAGLPRNDLYDQPILEPH